MEQILSNLHGLIDKKLQVFREIHKITLEQKKDIEENSADNIEDLVRRKQNYIDTIDAIDIAFSQQFSLLKEGVGVEGIDSTDAIKYPALGSLKSKVREVMDIASEIMKLEDVNNSTLTVLFDSLKQELKKINTGKKSLKAYEAPPMAVDAVYIDKKK